MPKKDQKPSRSKASSRNEPNTPGRYVPLEMFRSLAADFRDLQERVAIMEAEIASMRVTAHDRSATTRREVHWGDLFDDNVSSERVPRGPRVTSGKTSAKNSSDQNPKSSETKVSQKSSVVPSHPGEGRRENYRSNLRQKRRYLDWFLAGSIKMKEPKVLHPNAPSSSNPPDGFTVDADLWKTEFSKRYIAFRAALRRLVTSRREPIESNEDSMYESFQRIYGLCELAAERYQFPEFSDSWEAIMLGSPLATELGKSVDE